MAAAATAVKDADTEAESEAPPAKPSSRRKLILLAVPLLVAALLAGLWFSGILPNLLGLRHAEEHEVQAAPVIPVFVDLPEMIANLNGNAHRPSYVKLNARLEVASAQDAEKVRQAMPRVQDLFQTYLREMRPEELRGSAGSYRLREELITRANIAVAPAHVTDVLFVQMLVQ